MKERIGTGLLLTAAIGAFAFCVWQAVITPSVKKGNGDLWLLLQEQNTQILTMQEEILEIRQVLRSLIDGVTFTEQHVLFLEEFDRANPEMGVMDIAYRVVGVYDDRPDSVRQQILRKLVQQNRP